MSSHGCVGQCVPFHTDYSARTMQIALNEEGVCDGGLLVLATLPDGKFVVPSRRAGTFTIHTRGVVHGVTALRSGVRYSLFLCDTRQDVSLSQIDAAVVNTLQATLLNSVRAQFDFFERAVSLLEIKNGHVLGRTCEEYHSFLTAARGTPTTPPASLLVEILWRTHQLRPLLYRQCCIRLARSNSYIDHTQEKASADLTSWAGIDLVAAVNRCVRNPTPPTVTWGRTRSRRPAPTSPCLGPIP